MGCHSRRSPTLWWSESRATGLCCWSGISIRCRFKARCGATLEGDRLHGLGATDMKGGLAVMIHLIEALGPEKVTCVFYAGEEGPLPGNQLSRVLDEAAWLTRSSAAVVLEPTDRAIEAGCQGVINADVVFTGRPAHSARPWLGENAITKVGRVPRLPRGTGTRAACRERPRVPRGDVRDRRAWWRGPECHPSGSSC